MDVRTITLTPTVTVRQSGYGRFFKLVEAPAAVTVQLLRDGSPIGEIGRDVLGGYKAHTGDWSDDAPLFDGFEITSATSQTITVATSLSAGDYDRAVSQVDIKQTDSVTWRGADVASATGVAFDGFAKLLPTAATYQTIQLYNPAGSGVVVAVDMIHVTPQTAQIAGYEIYNAALGSATLSMARPKKNGIYAGAPAQSKAEIRTGNEAANYIGAHWLYGTSVGFVHSIPQTPPMILEEGYGVVLQHEVVNQLLRGGFQWREY